MRAGSRPGRRYPFVARPNTAIGWPRASPLAGVRAPAAGNRTSMSKKTDQQEQQAAARQAKKEGLSPSEAGVTTGASKQMRHVSTGDDRHEHSSAQGKSKT